jgi:cytoskeletal protein CcmA (bactofilin family)
MSIWKDLTQPESFAGEFDTAIETQTAIGSAQQLAAPRLRHDGKESLIGTGVLIEGTVSGECDIRIAGDVRGDVRIKGDLAVEPGARIVGAVDADSINLAGAVEGNLNASHQVKLLETGRLVGDLKAKIVTVAAGARMRGKVDFGWNEPETKALDQQKLGEPSETKPAA